MANASFEEVVQRLRTLLEENAKVNIIRNNDNSTTIQTRNGKFIVPQNPPNIINKSVGRFR